ncbi:PIG-L deacetylase family protein [Ramlibacter humi]|uniref:GlcNAc-PI de-N-acetylase n=1 Tax=Ramlibacter humi TaxID=2530451 RepID=A0A4Z0BYK6_9BURK|nr:PIG-L family deacetylase [Ramlibacter humi]TFZ03604.1 GlcNAc-PI de-N-acetylase [Ramlibacter humi]
MPHPRPAFFLQPHYDDVALSCGGTAAAWAAAGMSPTIVTVFASELVHSMVGEFAAWKHSRWRLDDPDAVQATRRAEDEESARALGCNLRWLGLPDAIYRGDRYTSDESLYGPLHPDEPALAAHLVEELLNLPEWQDGGQWFVPLGVGSHVDHQLVFETGRMAARRGVEVWAYEDLPYGIHTPEGLPLRLRQIEGEVGPCVPQPIGQRDMEAKLAAVASYESQLRVIFRFTDDFGATLQRHAEEAGGPLGRAERLWRVLA